MKIYAIVHKDNGEIRRYPAFRLDFNAGVWSARYSIIENGHKATRRVEIDGEKARIEVER